MASQILNKKVAISLMLSILFYILQPIILPISSIFTADAQSIEVANIFSPPLGFRDGLKYGIRITYDNNNNLIENTDYGIQNPDLSHFSNCFNLNMRELLHAGEDWYRIDRNSTSGAEVTAIANGVVYDYNPAWSYPGKAVVLKHLLPNGNYIYSIYMHLNDDISVATGDTVVRGQRIGSILQQTYDGRFPSYHSTDDSHLHFEIRTFASASNIYADHPSCNLGDAAGRGYTHPTFPPDSYPSSSNHYTDPGNFIYSHAGVFLPLIMKPTCVEGAQFIANGGFEQGNASWNVVSNYNIIISYPTQSPVSPRTGSWLAFLGGANNINNDTNMERLSQDISFISNTSSFTFTYYDKILSGEGTTQPWDYLYVRLYDGNWGFIQTIDTMDNRSKDLGYIARSINVQINPQWIGQTLHLSFEANTDSTNLTDFFIDDVGLVTHCN